jgi:hypothetical protein
VRIIPDVRLAGAHLDLSFARFSFRERKLARAAVVEINRLIVQCAEDVVFYRDDRDWISAFVAKYRDYCIETVTDRIPHGTGFVIDTRQRIVRHPKRAA